VYRGGAGQWAWWLHRWSGLGVLLFLVIHILDTALILFGPDLYNKVIRIYTHPLFRVGEVGLAGAVLYHALNGVRITLLDFFPEWSHRQQQLYYGVLALFAVLFLPAAFLMIRPLL
jgi:succinate dehydrogenase / fumarate reductase cytochrome b subunit